MTYEIGTADRARVWTYRTSAIVAVDEAEARTLFTNQALRDVPEATVEVLSIRRTPTGRYSAMIRRVRPVRDDRVRVVGPDVHGNVPPVGATGIVESRFDVVPVIFQLRGAGLGEDGNGIGYFTADALAVPVAPALCVECGLFPVVDVTVGGARRLCQQCLDRARRAFDAEPVR